jgi:hypothetical protein
VAAAQSPAGGARQHALRIAVPETAAPANIRKFGKFEVSFAVNTRATMLHWPYDAAPPNGLPRGLGITVDGVFVDPAGKEYRQPAFYYQQFEDAVRDGRDWHYPTTRFAWKVRFSPDQTGAWKYKIVARDQSGSAETEWRSFTVTPSDARGFVRVSAADARYFEFDNGALFTGLGMQVPEYLEDPTTKGGPAYQQLATSGINFVRLWVSSLYGSAWNPWVGGRNRYGGYLPITGLVPLQDEAAGATTLAMRLDYEPTGDNGWFDACRLQWPNDADAVKPNTRYRVRATYRGRRITGPRVLQSPDFGFVVKLGGMFPNCYEPGNNRVLTTYGRDASQWQTVEGVWNSGNRSFLPKLHLALENVKEGAAFVRSVSVREILADGTEGPEILARPSMEHHLYIPQERAHALDKVVELAGLYGVYLKLVVMEKGDEIYLKMGDNGEFVTDRDNQAGFYGVGRTVNKTRWLQQTWWRYLQARWGYSPNIHSWELVNEGDPASVRHYELADEFGKFMHYGVFGGLPGSRFDHPNDHLVTTSFWHSFPAGAFWASSAYPNVDYADLHAYVSTSTAPAAEKEKMQWDAAYYHTWHSQFVAAARIGKPVVRGEAGLDVPGRQDENALGLQRDRSGVWLHNFLWSGLDAGALYEVYWWRSHVWNNRLDHRGAYRLVNLFLADLALNKGGYSDWSGTVSNSAIRVVGQKNVRAGAMHLWIQNSRHTWKNVADGRPVEPVSGEIRVPGFRPGTPYEVEWWDTYATGKPVVNLQDVKADASGHVTLTIDSLQKDVAVKLRSRETGSRTNTL